MGKAGLYYPNPEFKIVLNDLFKTNFKHINKKKKNRINNYLSRGMNGGEETPPSDKILVTFSLSA